MITRDKFTDLVDKQCKFPHVEVVHMAAYLGQNFLSYSTFGSAFYLSSTTSNVFQEYFKLLKAVIFVGICRISITFIRK